ncbi:unnamed protein product [Ranitomeya imitator]|uniref:C1q domain-containing protein n=1 Tax=Ranitomeya imitator TaxID=111125 RepID=A0ABN9KNC2_9NEOB|nr:unnamed protein product [Ranitomeya imitator]
MNSDGKPVPLRCVLMTISMGVLLVLLSACPACTHKNRGSKFEDTIVTALPSPEIPVLTPPQKTDTTVEKISRKGTGEQTPKLSPKYSWLLFLKHADREAKNKRRGHEDSSQNHHTGPIGPPAPSRHHNQAINHVSREKKLSQFLQLLSDILVKQKDGDHLPPTVLPAKVLAAFTCRTIGDILVDAGEMKELQNYQRLLLEGSFYRSAGLNLTSGRYTAPFTGLYAFYARLRIEPRSAQGSDGFSACDALYPVPLPGKFVLAAKSQFHQQGGCRYNYIEWSIVHPGRPIRVTFLGEQDGFLARAGEGVRFQRRALRTVILLLFLIKLRGDIHDTQDPLYFII